MSYYVATNTGGSDDLTDGSQEDIYGGLISGGIVDGGYESFLGGLCIQEESSSDESDDDRKSSSSESSSSESETESNSDDEDRKKPPKKVPKKALNKLLEDPDIQSEPIELDKLEDEHHEQTIEDILNMDGEDNDGDGDGDEGDLDEVSGGGKTTLVLDIFEDADEDAKDDDAENKVENRVSEPEVEDQEVFGIEDPEDRLEDHPEDLLETEILFEEPLPEDSPDVTFGAEDVTFGVEDVEAQEDVDLPDESSSIKPMQDSRPDNLELAHEPKSEPKSGGSHLNPAFGSALSAYLTA